MQTFYAPGKILLCGEYLVLKGFNGIAVPTQKGQWLEVFEFETPENKKDTIIYTALDFEGYKWIEWQGEINTIQKQEISTESIDFLIKFLKLLPKKSWKKGCSYRFETRLEFNQNWGLGSSSTFISLLCQYFRLDPFKMEQKLFGGSGYDIAIAELKQPLIFWKNKNGANFRTWSAEVTKESDWSVVFLNEKVNSRKSSELINEAIQEISDDAAYQLQFQKIIEMIELANDIFTIEAALEMYQLLLGQITNLPTPYQFLNIKPVKQGLCKWLGAWGGDMILVNNKVLEEYPNVFTDYQVCPWSEIVKYEK